MGVGDASGSMQRGTRMSPQGSRPSRFAQEDWQSGCGRVRQGAACGCDLRQWCCGVWVSCRGRWAGLGCFGLLQCKPGEDKAGNAAGKGRQRGQGSRQGTAVRRIEGFEKRQSAKPKRCLSHPPWLRSCVSGSTYAPGGMSCCAALPVHCRGYVVRTAMRVSFLFFCGRELASVATVVPACCVSPGFLT